MGGYLMLTYGGIPSRFRTMRYANAYRSEGRKRIRHGSAGAVQHDVTEGSLSYAANVDEICMRFWLARSARTEIAFQPSYKGASFPDLMFKMQGLCRETVARCTCTGHAHTVDAQADGDEGMVARDRDTPCHLESRDVARISLV